MLNQIRRIWSDTGKNDKDFTDQETKLKVALEDVKQAAATLGRAAQAFLDVINSK